MADQSNPLEGLTADQADDAITRLAAKIDQQEQSLSAAKAHLKLMKAARKTLTAPDLSGDGVAVNAEPAQITVEGGQP